MNRTWRIFSTSVRRLFLLLLTACCASCAERATSQTAPAPTTTEKTAKSSQPAPEGWILYPSPASDGPDIRCANYSQREWRVATEGEGLKISPDARSNHVEPLPPVIKEKRVVVYSKSARRVLRVEDGWLVGLDAGEFGGGLWWFNSDGGDGKLLSNDRVVGFAEGPKGVLVLTGIAHLGVDHGEVLLVKGGAGVGRSVEPLADLGAAPRAFVAETGDSLLVMTTRALVRVKSSGAVERLMNTNYGMLYANSMTLSPSGVIHVGMRHFITRLTPSADGYKEEWFVPASCPSFSIRDFDCVCARR